MLDREINQQSTKLPPYVVFCFGITYDCVKRVQASNNTLLDKPVNGVACPSNVESEAPNMRIDIQKRNMKKVHSLGTAFRARMQLESESLADYSRVLMQLQNRMARAASSEDESAALVLLSIFCCC